MNKKNSNIKKLPPELFYKNTQINCSEVFCRRNGCVKSVWIRISLPRIFLCIFLSLCIQSEYQKYRPRNSTFNYFSHGECCEKFCKITGRHLYWNLFFTKVAVWILKSWGGVEFINACFLNLSHSSLQWELGSTATIMMKLCELIS